MSTFIGQLIGFAVIVYILWRFVVPPVKTLMQKQQDAVRTALAESAEAAKKLADADAMHAKALKDAKAELANFDQIKKERQTVLSGELTKALQVKSDLQNAADSGTLAAAPSFVRPRAS